MRKIILLAFIAFTSAFCHGQITQLNWEQIKAKAKAENKYIFMDCYATWCAPCKWMDENVLSDTMVVNYLQRNFITVKVQFDRTQKDNEDVKSWYADAHKIEQDFTIGAFPTYLFFSPNGEAVHKFEGSTTNSLEFIDYAKRALDSKTQIYTLFRQRHLVAKDSLLLRNTILAAKTLKHTQVSDSLMGDYLASLKVPFLPSNIKFVASNIRSSRFAGFDWLFKNAERIDGAVKSKTFAESLIAYIIGVELIEPLLRKISSPISWAYIKSSAMKEYGKISEVTFISLRTVVESNIIEYELTSRYTDQFRTPDWKLFEGELSKKYPDFDVNALITAAKPTHFRKLKEWNSCAKAMLDYLETADLEDEKRNDLIWRYLFLFADDKAILNSGLKYIKKIVGRNPAETNFMDTYANLLYKLGRRDSAITWTENAIRIERAKKSPNIGLIESFEQTLEKIKKNIKTWSN